MRMWAWISRIHVKRQVWTVCQHRDCVSEAETGFLGLVVHQPSSRFSDRPCLKGIMAESYTAGHQMSSSGLHMYIVSPHTHTHTHTHNLPQHLLNFASSFCLFACIFVIPTILDIIGAENQTHDFCKSNSCS